MTKQEKISMLIIEDQLRKGWLDLSAPLVYAPEIWLIAKALAEYKENHKGDE